MFWGLLHVHVHDLYSARARLFKDMATLFKTQPNYLGTYKVCRVA